MKRDYQGGSTLENSFGHGASNKSYERILAETIEAQNTSSGNYGGNYKLSSTGAYQNLQNMTLQLSSKRGGPGSANVSQSRFNAQGSHNGGESLNNRVDKSLTGHQTSKSNHASHKSLSNSKARVITALGAKYDQQQRRKSRDHQYNLSQAQRSKCESNRNSKKSSPNNTINSVKGTLILREARTKPASPERSLAALNKKPYQIGAGVNQREERKALNMMSHLNNQLPQQVMIPNRVGNHQQDFASIQQQQQTKRKNFKNMFYSPKGDRDAYTEPHSKYPSQVNTKEHSPANRVLLDMSQQLSNTGQHPLAAAKVRTSASKPPTHIKNKSTFQGGKPLRILPGAPA